jgi:hypothetical protein
MARRPDFNSNERRLHDGQVSPQKGGGGSVVQKSPGEALPPGTGIGEILRALSAYRIILHLEATFDLGQIDTPIRQQPIVLRVAMETQYDPLRTVRKIACERYGADIATSLDTNMKCRRHA